MIKDEYRRMTLPEQEELAKKLGIKSPRQRLWDNEKPIEHEEYAKCYYSLWVIKDV